MWRVLREVDEKLVILSRQLRCPILDQRLQTSTELQKLQGVTVPEYQRIGERSQIMLFPEEVMSVRVMPGKIATKPGCGLHG